jgi:DNA-binding NtrC family response regulator
LREFRAAFGGNGVAENAIAQCRVLLVDDEPFFRGLTAHLLADLGCRHFLKAGNGREALELLDRADNHVIVTKPMPATEVPRWLQSHGRA